MESSNQTNIIGQKFGRLTVLSTIWRDRQTFCDCICECGTSCVVRARILRAGRTKSCGCFRRENGRKVGQNLEVKFRLPVGEAAFRNLYSRYKADAARRKHSFELNETEFRSLITQPCFYCDALPAQKHYASPSKRKSRNASNGHFVYNGIDRMDNDLGYRFGNCVPCCKKHNYMKRGLSLEQFISECKFLAVRFADKSKAA